MSLALIRAAILGPAIFSCAVTVQAATVIDDDLARRSPKIHWAAGFAPETADVFAHNDIQIGAPCGKVFKVLAAAEQWPAWYANAKDVRVRGGGALTKGSRFAWNTFGLAVRSKVHEFDAGRRIGWFGDAADLKAYHTWLLTPRDGGCFVQGEEVVNGQGAIAMRKADPAAMHKGHDLWNQALKAAVERR